jgi:hypothetical protein
MKNSSFYSVVVYLSHILPHLAELLSKCLNYETLTTVLPQFSIFLIFVR